MKKIKLYRLGINKRVSAGDVGVYVGVGGNAYEGIEKKSKNTVSKWK